MHLKTVLTATLPLLALVSASPPGWSKGNPVDIKLEDTNTSNNLEEHEHADGKPDGGMNMTSHHEHHSLQARRADAIIRECDFDGKPQTCYEQVVVKAADLQGICHKSRFIETYDATISLLDDSVMCYYFETDNCNGRRYGPFSNKILEYTFNHYNEGWWKWKPNSFACQRITFDNAPIRQKADGNCEAMLFRPCG